MTRKVGAELMIETLRILGLLEAALRWVDLREVKYVLLYVSVARKLVREGALKSIGDWVTVKEAVKKMTGALKELRSGDLEFGAVLIEDAAENLRRTANLLAEIAKRGD